MIVLVLGSSSTYSPHINHSGQDSLTEIIFRAPIFRSGFEARSNKKQQYKAGRYKMRTADCRLQTGYEMQTRYKMQTADWVQNAEWEFILFSWSSTFRGIHTLICAYVPYIVIGLHEEPPHKHTYTNKKDTACLITSAHPTSSQHNLFSDSHHDECTSFLNTQLRKNKIKIK